MGVNLQILGMQSIPRLAEKLEVEVKFPTQAFTMSLNVGFKKLFEDCGRILNFLIEEYKMSWWDVYRNSDIGLERIALAQEMQLDKGDIVLDVGCGRGYFSIAAARLSKLVVGVDLMNGHGRRGWWSNFTECMRELNLANRVMGVKSDAKNLPFKSGSFTLTASVHAIRNFADYQSIEASIEEMKRIVAKGGNVIVVESLPVARNKAQEAHLEMFKCKVKYAWGELDFPTKENIVRMFQKVGFKDVEVKELDYNWSVAPPVFCINHYLPSLPNSERKKAKKAYDKAVNMISKWGEVSPPTLLVRARK